MGRSRVVAAALTTGAFHCAWNAVVSHVPDSGLYDLVTEVSLPHAEAVLVPPTADHAGRSARPQTRWCLRTECPGRS